MDSQKLKDRLAELESEHQNLMDEYVSLDQVLEAIGFPYGLASLKEVAAGLIQEQSQQVNYDTEIH